MPREGPRGPKCHLLGRFGPKRVPQTRSELASVLRSSDDQKRKVGIFVKTRRMPRVGPRGPKCQLLCRIGPKKVLQAYSELASRLRASDDQKSKVGIFVKTRLGPREGPRGSKCHLLGRIGPKKVLQTHSELASRLCASDGQKSKGGIFVKTRLGSTEGPIGAKCHLFGGIGPKKVLQSRSEMASRFCTLDGQKWKVGIFVKTRLGPRQGPRGPNVTCLVELSPKKFRRLAANWRVDCTHQMAKNRRSVFS